MIRVEVIKSPDLDLQNFRDGPSLAVHRDGRVNLGSGRPTWAGWEMAANQPENPFLEAARIAGNLLGKLAAEPVGENCVTLSSVSGPGDHRTNFPLTFSKRSVRARSGATVREPSRSVGTTWEQNRPDSVPFGQKGRWKHRR